MTQDLTKVRESLEEISSNAKKLKNSLMPIERKVRETAIEYPTKVILDHIYNESFTIQRIASFKAIDKERDRVTMMQGKAIFPFAIALYMPVEGGDFIIDSSDFFGRFHSGYLNMFTYKG